MGDCSDLDNLSQSGSDSSREELESELYSVVHYNSFSEDLPNEILEKYNIKRNNNNEFFVSLKNSDITKIEADSSITNIEANSLNKDSSTVVGHSKEVTSDIPCRDKNSLESPNDSNFVEVISNCSEDTPQISIDISPPKNGSAMKSIVDNNIILISDSNSDSGSDSDVIIQEEAYEVCSVSSTDSVEIVTNSKITINNMILNTMQRPTCIFPPDDGIEENIKIKWREVASPYSWSEGMRRYYNRASKRLKNFDCEQILKEIRDKGTWDINAEDKFPNRKRPVKRCSFCRQVDHLVKDCPKRFSNCSMCGNPGHRATNCPFRMCLNCGEQNQVFVALCRKCESEKNKRCDECNQIGHVKSNCPDTWRRYHATTTDGLNVKPQVLNEKLMCCNCGLRGHLYENCRNLYWSSYPPTSFLVQNNRELQHNPGKRKSFSNFRDQTPESAKPKKKARWSEQPGGFKKRRYFNDSPGTPKNKKKNKKKSPNFKNIKNRGFKNRHSF